MNRRANKCPPAGGAAEGASIALGANATPSYIAATVAGKHGIEPIGNTGHPNFRKPEKGTRRTGKRVRRSLAASVTFRASTGRIWAYTGKRGRVLQMLATMSEGVTQWDCLPWHTRLGASIHVLRQDGLVIETALEGEYRHARYTLRTAGSLIGQATTGDFARAREGNAS